jgi:hypothetical protein
VRKRQNTSECPTVSHEPENQPDLVALSRRTIEKEIEQDIIDDTPFSLMARFWEKISTSAKCQCDNFLTWGIQSSRTILRQKILAVQIASTFTLTNRIAR